MALVFNIDLLDGDERKFHYTIPYLRIDPYYYVPQTEQALASTLFFAALSNAFLEKRISFEEVKSLVKCYQTAPFIYNIIKDPLSLLNLSQDQVAGSYVYISLVDEALIINYNIVFFASLSTSYINTSTTPTPNYTLYDYTGTIFVTDKVHILQTFQNQPDPDYNFSIFDPNYFNFTLSPIKDDKKDKIEQRFPPSLEEIKSTLILFRSSFQQLGSLFNNKQIKKMIKSETKHWKTVGQWFVLPDKTQFIIGFVGKILTSKSWMNLQFNLKMLFGTVILEFSMENTAVPVYMGPFYYLTSSNMLSTAISGLPVRPTFRSEKDFPAICDCSTCIYLYPLSGATLTYDNSTGVFHGKTRTTIPVVLGIQTGTTSEIIPLPGNLSFTISGDMAINYQAVICPPSTDYSGFFSIASGGTITFKKENGIIIGGALGAALGTPGVTVAIFFLLVLLAAVGA